VYTFSPPQRSVMEEDARPGGGAREPHSRRARGQPPENGTAAAGAASGPASAILIGRADSAQSATITPPAEPACRTALSPRRSRHA
jgi:hypothetical protein